VPLSATTLQAGNSPQTLFGHYRGPARNTEAEALFAAAPTRAENVIQLATAARKRFP
jgi:hypothetical protein